MSCESCDFRCGGRSLRIEWGSTLHRMSPADESAALSPCVGNPGFGFHCHPLDSVNPGFNWRAPLVNPFDSFRLRVSPLTLTLKRRCTRIESILGVNYVRRKTDHTHKHTTRTTPHNTTQQGSTTRIRTPPDESSRRIAHSIAALKSSVVVLIRRCTCMESILGVDYVNGKYN